MRWARLMRATVFKHPRFSLLSGIRCKSRIGRVPQLTARQRDVVEFLARESPRYAWAQPFLDAPEEPRKPFPVKLRRMALAGAALGISLLANPFGAGEARHAAASAASAQSVVAGAQHPIMSQLSGGEKFDSPTTAATAPLLPVVKPPPSRHSWHHGAAHRGMATYRTSLPRLRTDIPYPQLPPPLSWVFPPFSWVFRQTLR